MKIKIVPCLIAVAATALITFGLYSLCHNADLRWLLTIFGGVSLLLTIGAMFAVSLPDKRTTINISILSGVFAGILLVIQVIFALMSSFSVPVYVILNGLLLLVWFGICYGIARAMK